ncbi:DUF1566 domain-containing protein [Xanthomonas theicola]|uniref:DUF1566 domain-containing protein n=1 Tax=Xanthomonas theicola TaxID=56464 RepID=A0A2S6ZM05_9XANT|nr:DUF1566 domain-containing protein [Xanthomonas theicola]PPT93236.1 hypothetical protein XthCFBP4691_01085 [Xanthomonas theicola]QNH24829.1 DUF1566 domain-containing protein [Xanthomonas theicola]
MNPQKILLNVERLTINITQPPRGAELSAVLSSVAEGVQVPSEYRDLGGGDRIPQAQALREVAELGTGWRLETPHELFGLVDYGHKNKHGAYTRDESLKEGPYWTSQETPWFEGGRVVVGFYGGYVYDHDADGRAFARAVRVVGQ